MVTRVENRLNLFRGKDFRLQLRLCEGDRAPPLGSFLVTWCRNGLYRVADQPRPPAGAMVTNSPVNSTPWRAWNPQNDVNAASLRFTLAAEQ